MHLLHGCRLQVCILATPNLTTMADSEADFVVDSDDEIGNTGIASSAHGTRSGGRPQRSTETTTRGGDAQGTARRRAAWEDIQRSWDTVVEGADGSINSTVEGLREAGKRQRYFHTHSTTSPHLDI